MSYARNLLSRGEEVVFESRQHWLAIVARTWKFVLLAVLGLALVIWLASNDRIFGEPIDGLLSIIGLLALLVALARFGWVIWDWRNQEWLITTRRVVRAEGILNKRMADSSLEKINDARLDQSLLGRIFDYGTLDILTAAEEAGGGQVDDFPMIAEPVKFKISMLNQKELLERPDLAPAAWQRQAPRPELQRPDPMPPRAGSTRVQEVPGAPTPATAAATPGAGSGAPAASGSGAPAASGGPPPAAPDPRSPSEELAITLERLAGLRDRGLITQEEYESKKRQLLERL